MLAAIYGQGVVIMAAKVTNRIVIEGGALSEPWVPKEIIMSAGSAFIELSRSDRKLQRFINIPTKSNNPLAVNAFLDDLMKKRNAAVDDAIWSEFKKADQFLQDDERTKIMKQRRGTVEEHDMPEVVTIDLQGLQYSGDNGVELSVGDISIKCSFRLSPIRKVAVECAADVLDYVRCACLHAAACADRDSQDGVRSKRLTIVPGVLCDKRRKVLYMLIKGEDGSLRRVQAKPLAWESTFIEQCAQGLRDEVESKGGAVDCDDAEHEESQPEDGHAMT